MNMILQKITTENCRIIVVLALLCHTFSISSETVSSVLIQMSCLAFQSGEAKCSYLASVRDSLS